MSKTRAVRDGRRREALDRHVRGEDEEKNQTEYGNLSRGRVKHLDGKRNRAAGQTLGAADARAGAEEKFHFRNGSFLILPILV